MRNDLGWFSWYDVGIIPRESDALSWLYPEDESNQFFDDMVSFGMDLRVQSTRSFTSPDAKRATFPMQATLYGSFRPVKAMTLEGQFNVASLRTAPNSDVRIRFPGQRMGLFSAILAPDPDLPSVRLGLFRPAIGIRYDDHTMFAYSYVTSTTRRNYLGPDWGEWGSELTWESKQWLTVNLGIFGSEGLSQVRLSDGLNEVSAVSGNTPTVTARAVFWPKAFEDLYNGYIGGSVLVNNDYRMVSTFLGIGITDYLYLMADLTQVSKDNVSRSTNVTTELGWSIWDPLIVYARYEVGNTSFEQLSDDVSARSVIFGSQIFVMPYVELRPEYRIWDTDLPGTTSRWNVQLHIFY